MNQSRGDSGTCHGDSGWPCLPAGIAVSITIAAVCESLDATYGLEPPTVHDDLDESRP